MAKLCIQFPGPNGFEDKKNLDTSFISFSCGSRRTRKNKRLKLYKALVVSKQIFVLHKVFVLFRIHLTKF